MKVEPELMAVETTGHSLYGGPFPVFSLKLPFRLFPLSVYPASEPVTTAFLCFVLWRFGEIITPRVVKRRHTLARARAHIHTLAGECIRATRVHRMRARVVVSLAGGREVMAMGDAFQLSLGIDRIFSVVSVLCPTE